MAWTVSASSDFDPDYPEEYLWEDLDSLIVSTVGAEISRAIHDELQTAERRYVPGLRRALNTLARHTMER